MTQLLCASSFQKHLKVESEIWDLKFWAKLGLFWDHFWTFLGLLVIIFMRLQKHAKKTKTCKKDKNTRCRNISHFKIYLMVSRYETLMRGPESIKYMHNAHDTLYMSK